MDEKKDKKGKKKLIVFIVILGILLVAGGGVLTYLTSAKYVTKTVIKNMSKNVTSYIGEGTITGLEENYKKISTIKINLKSDYYASLATTDPNYGTLAKLFTNLSNTENKLTVVQDKENKKLLVDYDSKLATKSLVRTKYLVENATEYYYIDGVTNSYINNGNNNYFESLNSATTSKENEIYIIEKIAESMEKNIKEEYISESYEEEYKKVSITLTEKDIVEFGNNILTDLKNDSKANQIMTGYNKDFAKMKITNEDVAGMDHISLHVYLDKMIGTVKKYDFEFGDFNIVYIKGEEKLVEFRQSDEIIMKLKIKTQNDKTEIAITDQEDNEMGNISITKTDTNCDVIINIEDETTSMNIGYNYQLKNLKKNKSYESTTTMTMNIASNNTTILEGTITIDSNVDSDTTIKEDVSSSVLASSVSSSQEQLLNQKMTTIMQQLMS